MWGTFCFPMNKQSKTVTLQVTFRVLKSFFRNTMKKKKSLSAYLMPPKEVITSRSFVPTVFGLRSYIYYIDSDEIPGLLLLLKKHIFTACSKRFIFIFHM